MTFWCLTSIFLFCLLSGYLKKHHSTLFHPPLPLHKLQSVQRLGFGTNNKIFIEFDSPWWDGDCEVIYLVWEDEVSSEAINNVHIHIYICIALFTPALKIHFYLVWISKVFTHLNNFFFFK